jgi:thymidine phosphorylase
MSILFDSLDKVRMSRHSVGSVSQKNPRLVNAILDAAGYRISCTENTNQMSQDYTYN